MSRACLTHYGENLTENKIFKKINMKTELKKKTDRNVTGSKAIKLKEWEKILLELLEGKRGENPSDWRAPGATTSGVANNGSVICEPPQAYKPQLSPRPSPKKKKKLLRKMKKQEI